MAIKTSLALKHYLNAHTGLEFRACKVSRDTKLAYKSNQDVYICVLSPVGYVFSSTLLNEVSKFDNTIIKHIKNDTCKLPLSIWNEIIFSNKVDFLSTIVVKNETNKIVPNKLNNYNKIVDLIKVKGADRNLYAKEELTLIATYEGKGGLAKEGIRGTGILSEFYTPDSICAKMWGLAYKHGYTGTGKVLEPSCGIGRFLKYANPILVDAYEIDIISYTVCKLLYPEANITLASFETKFFRGSFHTPKVEPIYSLVIGNPPYESYQSQYSSKEKQVTGAFTFDQYFITRGIDLLIPGGVMVFIVPSSFMRNEHKYNKLKEDIEAKATLVEAYRLPNESFHNTYVGTDILVFKKK